MSKLTKQLLKAKGIKPIDTHLLAHIEANAERLDFAVELEKQIRVIEQELIDFNIAENIWTYIDGEYYTTESVRQALNINLKWINNS